MGFVKFLLNVIFCKFSKLRQNKNTAIPKNLQTNFRGRTRKLLNKDWKANFLARAARPARAARAARAAHRLNIAWSSSKKPYVELGTPTSKISKTCKPSGTEARIAEKRLERKISPSGWFFLAGGCNVALHPHGKCRKLGAQNKNQKC